MDLNYLYKRQQVSLIQADAAVSPAARTAHEQRAQAYGEMIEDVRRTGGVPDRFDAIGRSLAPQEGPAFR